MKKLLILCEAFYPEDFIINDLAAYWAEKGYEMEVLTRAPSYPYGKVYAGYKNKLYQQTDFKGIKIHRFPIIPGYQKSSFIKIVNYLNFVFFSLIILLFIGKRFDRIFIYQTGPLTQAIAGVISKKVYKSKLIIWTQDLWPDSVFAYGFKKTKLMQFLLNCLVKFIYKNCDEIIVSCEGFVKKLKTFVPGKKIKYIPNWPIIDECKITPVKIKAGFNFTFTGNIGKMQNIENVILGFHQFNKLPSDIYLNIVGDGSNLSNLKDLVLKNKIPNINFTGRRPLEEMPSYFEQSNVLILSLIDEPIYEITIPSKFQTYLTASKPIYAIIKGELRDLVIKHEIGIISDPSDIDDIALGFEKLYSLDNISLATMSRNASKLLKSDFSKKENMDKLSEFIIPDKNY